jgi:hypothetical protein
MKDNENLTFCKGFRHSVFFTQQGKSVVNTNILIRHEYFGKLSTSARI